MLSTPCYLCVQKTAHNNILETEALLLWLRWLLRNKNHHETRAICLCDSKVTIGGVGKGRSSSRPLLRVLRRIAAISLAGNVLTRLIYVPTEANPADAPSRGVRVRSKHRKARYDARVTKTDAKRQRYHDRLHHIIERSPYRDELEALCDDPSFWTFRPNG